MAFFGALMMIGMGAGLAGTAALDSTKNVTDTCNKISSAKQTLSDTESQYEKLFNKAATVNVEIDKYINAIGTQKTKYESMTKASKEFATIDKNSKIVGLSIFLFVLLLSLLLKYFNVFGLIWGLFK